MATALAISVAGGCGSVGLAGAGHERWRTQKKQQLVSQRGLLQDVGIRTTVSPRLGHRRSRRIGIAWKPRVVCIAEPSLIAKLDSAERTYKELTVRLADPAVTNDPSEYQVLVKSISELKEIVTAIKNFESPEVQLDATKELGEDASGDRETAEMVVEETRALELKIGELEDKLKMLLLPSKALNAWNIMLEDDTGAQSYMEDVHLLEVEERQAKYVPPPPIPNRDVNMRNRVEDLMYTLKDVIRGPLASIVDDENKWKATVNLFSETVELQNPLFCLRGKDSFLEWLQLLAHSGVVIDLHDIYYQNITAYQFNRWVYGIWTATLTKDLPMSILQLGLADWWARQHRPVFMNAQYQRDVADLEDCDGKLNAGLVACNSVADEQFVKNHVAKSTSNRVLQISGEAKLEMDESGQVTCVHVRWYRTAKQEEGDFTDAKLWLTGLLHKTFC